MFHFSVLKMIFVAIKYLSLGFIECDISFVLISEASSFATARKWDVVVE